MKQQFISVLLCGAMLFSGALFTSCSDDDVDDLKSRMTVVEGLIRELKEDLSHAITTGATITSATEKEGVWTLVLSSGETIVIKPTTGGGSDISVTKNENNVIIKLDGEEYVIPLGSGGGSLVYSPDFIDGIVKLDANGQAVVKLLARPALTENDLKNAEFSIAEAHELQTRSGMMFKVNEVTASGDFVAVKVRALNVEANKTYAVALQMKLNGSSISSNYFNVEIPDGYSFESEDIITPKLIAEAASSFKELDNGFSTAILPEAKVDFLGEFNFKELFTELPAGKVEFMLGSQADQNDAVNGRYDFFKGCLSSDGAWKMTARPGTNGAGPDDKPGLLVLLVVDDIVKAKIYWQVIDPLAGAEFPLRDKDEPHLEFNDWADKKGNFNIQENLYNGGDNNHNFGGFPEWWEEYTASTKDGKEVLYVDGYKATLTEFGEKMARHSRGIITVNVQSSVVDGETHEVITELDGISQEKMKDEYGVSISADGNIVFHDNYAGTPFRVGPGIRYEYDYGEITVAKSIIAYFWFNRK